MPAADSRVIVCNSSGLDKQSGRQDAQHIQVDVRDAINMPESPLANQGFDAVFIKNDFTGLVGHAIPITNLQIQSCGVSVHDYCSSFSIYGNPALILCIGMGELV